jgi:hypothetical protein
MILKKPIFSEKAVRLMEEQNKVLFEVEKSSNKKQIKEEFEKTFDVKVEKELRNYKISQENITDILSVIIKGAKLRANRGDKTSRDF